MSFVARFFLLVVLVGMAEVYLLVRFSAAIGVLATALLCVITGVLGGGLVRVQGLETLREIQQQVARGCAPALEIVSGLVLLVVGVLLITPGFLTDIAGFALLVPSLRRRAAAGLLRLIGPTAHFIDPTAPGTWDAAPQHRQDGRRIIDIDPQ